MADTIASGIQESGYDTPSQSHGDSNPGISQAGSSAAVSADGQQVNDSETVEFSQSDPISSQTPTIQEIKAQSPIYFLAKDCLQRFEGLRDVLHSSQSDKADQLWFDLDFTHNTIEDAQARFKAWGTNIAAFSNGTLRTSLDFRLAEAPGIKRRTLQVLEDLQEYLGEATLIIGGAKANETWNLDDTSDSSDYSDEDVSEQKDKESSVKEKGVGSDLDELLKAIKASNASLMKLSIVIRSSATRDDYLKAASRFKTWNPYPDIGHVLEKYGSARYSTNWLLERLGKAITRRRQFLKYRIEHNDRLAGMGNEEEGRREKPEKTIASTKATTFIGENVLQNVRAAGSDAGNSFGTATSYEATVFSGDGAPTMLTVPPPPRFAFPDIRFEYGQPFQCPYCFIEQIVKNKSAWKKHVFRDLKPYVCTFDECEMLMFRSRNEWFAHELQNHRREWVCQFCQHPAFATVSAFSKHTESTHRAVLASSPLKALILQSQEPVDKIPSTACPLCNDWEADMKRKQAVLESVQQSPNDSEKDSMYGKLKPFRRHLGRHMEQLALFALPSNDTEDLEDKSTDEEGGEFGLSRDKGQDVKDESSDEGEDEPEQIFEPGYETIAPHIPDTDLETGSSHGSTSSVNAAAIEAKDREDEEENEKVYQKRLEDDLRKSGMDERQIAIVLKKDKGVDPNRPTYTRMSRRHLSIETLNRFRIDYEFDQDPDYVLIKRWVPEYEQDFLWSHTREIRERRRSEVVLSIEGKKKLHHDTDVTEFELVKKTKHVRKPSPSPLLTFLAGGKR